MHRKYHLDQLTKVIAAAIQRILNGNYPDEKLDVMGVADGIDLFLNT